MSTILSKFINNNSIRVRSDEDFEKLKETATNLSKSVFRKKDQIIKYTLVAFDPDIDPDEPALKKVEKLVEKQSPTILSHSNDRPRTILRAVILESLYTRAMNDIDYARIIWLTASNVFHYYKLGNEKQILQEILLEIGEKVEKESLKEWSLISRIDIQELEELQIKLSEGDDLQAYISSFKKKFKNAILYQGWGGENQGVPHGSNQNWSNHFSELGANSVSQLIKQAFQSNNKNLEAITIKVNEYFQSLQPFFAKIGEQVTRGVKSVNNRSLLLWWKESLYSQSAKNSYREIQPELLPIVMAYDLHSIVNQNYPVSIDYFLKETISQLLKEYEDKVSFSVFLDIVNRDDFRAFIKAISSKPIDTSGRSSLLNYIIQMGNDEVDSSKELKKRLGIDPKKQISITELSVWIFHDLQALRTVLN